MRHLLLILLLTATMMAPTGGPAHAAEPLVADLSHHLVAITTGFAGTQVLLFGAVDDVPGIADVVVVVRGPARTQIVRRKGRRAGIWVNVGEAEIPDAPSFYHVAATRPLAQVAGPEALARHRIGLDNLGLAVRTGDPRAPAPEYAAALIRLKQADGLYGTRTDDIGFLSRRLFRTEVYFPANVPVGTYRVEVYLLVDGEVASTQVTPLMISKIGLGAGIFEFAQRYSAAYAIVAIMLAAGGGLAAAAAFKRGE